MSNAFDIHSLWINRSITKARGSLERCNNATGIIEVNRKDSMGRTVLQLIASETDVGALEWLELLLGFAGLQINTQDRESGWSALHRAMWVGNIAGSRLLLARSDVETQLKDREGLTAFDLYNSTVDGTNPSDVHSLSYPPRVELFTWGSNRNFILGLSGDGDRAFPEKVQLQRSRDSTSGLSAFEPVRVKDVKISRLHSAIITDESVPTNVRKCGFGGSNQQTQFTFSPLLDFPYQVAVIALSPDHTVLVTDEGAVFTFGTNRFHALGYAIDSTAKSTNEEAVQLIPKRVVGAIKKEFVIGAAACRSSTIVFTAEAIFSCGTNNGQLGYATAGGTKIQMMPRKITIIDAPMIAVSATDNATGCLSAAGDVLVLYQEAYIKVAFPLSRFPTSMPTYRPPQISSKASIIKLKATGQLFVALSSLGDVFSFSLESLPTSNDSSHSRVNIKPQRVWSQRRSFTAVTDVGVGLDGSIILSTVSGHVYIRNSKRVEGAGPKLTSGVSTPPIGLKAGSWSRVPYLQRVINVTASTGAYAALRSDVPLKLIDIEGTTLAQDLLSILPHWQRISAQSKRSKRVAASKNTNVESDDEDEVDAGIERDVEVATIMLEVLEEWDVSWEEHTIGSDVLVDVGDIRIPAHRLILSSRSPVLAKQLASTSRVAFACSPFTALLVLHYLYFDSFPPIWDSRIGSRVRDHKSTIQLDFAAIKSELQSLSTQLQLPALSRSLTSHVRSPPDSVITRIYTQLLATTSTSSTNQRPDIVLHLSDKSITAHSVILRSRSVFFATFYGDDDWSRSRKSDNIINFDFRHVRSEVMELILRYYYSDSGLQLFEHLERETADEVVEFVTEVLGVANELLADKLKLVCSSILRRFITIHNVCSILLDSAHFEAHDLTRICLQFISCSMETILEGRLLDDLSPDLIQAVAAYVQQEQGNRLPMTRSSFLVNELMVKHSGWLSELDYGRATGGMHKFDARESNSKGKGRQKSPRLGPLTSPRVRPSRSPATSPNMPPLRESIPFEMDDFSLDTRPHVARAPLSPTPPAPAPSRPTWTKVDTTTKSLDLRAIIASEAPESRSRPTQVVGLALDTSARSSTPRQHSSTPSTPLSTSIPRMNQQPWRPVETPPPSFLSIQSQQATPARPATAPPTPRSSELRRPSIPTSSSPVSPPVLHRDKSSHIITPVRQAVGSRSSSSSVRKGGFGAADVPWTNYTAPPSPSLPPSFSHSSPPSLLSLLPQQNQPQQQQEQYHASSSPPPISFASIQSEQHAAILSIQQTKAPRSFQSVIAQEAAESARRADLRAQRNEEEEFAKWWELESERVRKEGERDREAIARMDQAVRGNMDGSGGRGSKRGGGHSTRGKKANGLNLATEAEDIATSGGASRGAGRGRGNGRGRGGGNNNNGRGGNSRGGKPVATFVGA